MKNLKLTTIDEIFAGTAHFDEKYYNRNENRGFTLKPEILKIVNEEAEYLWNNGGKEIHDKLQTIPGFKHTEEFKNYMKKFNQK